MVSQVFMWKCDTHFWHVKFVFFLSRSFPFAKKKIAEGKGLVLPTTFRAMFWGKQLLTNYFFTAQASSWSIWPWIASQPACRIRTFPFLFLLAAGSCSEWFNPAVCSSPWSQPCAPDEQSRLVTLRDHFGFWFPPSPCSERKYLLHVCVFPGAAFLSVCLFKSLLANFFVKLPVWRFFFFPSVPDFLTKWWFVVVDKMWALWNS